LGDFWWGRRLSLTAWRRTGEKRKMRTVRVGLVGFGTIGSGVVKLIDRKRDEIARRTGIRLELPVVVDTELERDRGVALPAGVLTDDLGRILDDESIEIAVELVGGTTAARQIDTRLLSAGKHVVTANKALVATHWGELLDLAGEARVTLNFEAACNGAVPSVKVLREAMSANTVECIEGIFNGTTNYILTRMTTTLGLPYAEALTEAQTLGYAEPDPTLDVGGHDTAHKLAILARLAFGIDFDYAKLYVEGIEKVEPVDLKYAGDMGYVLKLLAIGRMVEDKVDLRVHPTLVRSEKMLAKVDGVFNAVSIRSDAAGESVLYGAGAGQMPTAGAVVADILDVAMGRAQATFERMAEHESRRVVEVLDIGEIVTRYYLRLALVDQPGVLAKVSTVLGRENISISSVIQLEASDAPGDVVPVVFMTHRARQANVSRALTEIERLEVVKGPSVLLRVEQ